MIWHVQIVIHRFYVFVSERLMTTKISNLFKTHFLQPIARSIEVHTYIFLIFRLKYGITINYNSVNNNNNNNRGPRYLIRNTVDKS